MKLSAFASLAGALLLVSSAYASNHTPPPPPSAASGAAPQTQSGQMPMPQAQPQVPGTMPPAANGQPNGQMPQKGAREDADHGQQPGHQEGTLLKPGEKLPPAPKGLPEKPPLPGEKAAPEGAMPPPPPPAPEAPLGPQSLKTQQDKVSYTIGVDLGTNFKKQGIAVRPELLMRGLRDALENKPLLLTKPQMMSTLRTLQTELIQKRRTSLKQKADKNRQVGDAFLAKNKTQKGVVTLENGLQYKIINPGKGVRPAKTDSVVVNYTGRLINGKVFDSTSKTGRPATFKVNEVIPGWTQALQLMRVGASWEVYVPSKLAYGARGAGGPIGPNQTLIFKIDLLGIKGKTKMSNQKNQGQKNQAQKTQINSQKKAKQS